MRAQQGDRGGVFFDRRYRLACEKRGSMSAVDEGKLMSGYPTPLAPVIGKTHRLPLLVRELLHRLVATDVVHRTQHMNLCDFDGRPVVGDLSDPLLERLRAVHGEPRCDHHDRRREPAEDGRVAAKRRSGDR